MDFGTAIGLIIGLGLILFGMFDYESQTIPQTFFSGQSLAIVLGGTLAATVVNYPLKQVLQMFRVAWKAFARRTTFDPVDLIDQLVEFGRRAKKEGIVSLESSLPQIKNHYMRIGLGHAMLVRDSKKLELFLDSEMDSMIKRHQRGQEMFYNMGTYAPAFGLLGTVMGLILMMTQQARQSTVASYASQMQDSMGQLLHGMGIALVTTFYGVLLANLVFIPIAGKLKILSDEEVHLNEIIKAGILSIHAKENHYLIKEKLMTYLEKEKRTEE
ncbi:MAG: flagellar motor protein MotA [Candidatus Neomarinimicrobiota bacterium]|nr:MAG: flagellar motor protein MotA [Candidatus Neomarinimicrobiota bacterium]